MLILAFDLATNTGVAVGEARAAPICMTERLGEAGSTHGARFSRMLDLTARLIERHKPEVIALEAAIAGGVVGGAERSQLAMGLRASVLGVAHRKRVRVYEYPVAAIRKHFIGTAGLKRDVAKTRTIQRCHQLGIDVRNDNEADAVAAWHYCAAKLRLSRLPVAGGLGL